MLRHEKFSSIGNQLTHRVNAGKLYKTNRRIDEIVVHCSASPQDRNDDAFTIDKWHIDRFDSGIGYHYIILPNGAIQKGRWVDYPGAHTKGNNRYTIGICFIGGMVLNDITTQQLRSLRNITRLLISDTMYGLLPENIKGHNECRGHKNRGCPMMNVDMIREFGVSDFVSS